MYRTIESCRICGNETLIPVVDLGRQALTGVFPRGRDQDVPVGPLTLVKCSGGTDTCGLLQLQHSFAGEVLYGNNYGYRSGLNRSMVAHLAKIVEKAQTWVQLRPADLVLDIGSNDGTLLSHYPKTGLKLVGIDPTGPKFAKYYPPAAELIPSFFRAGLFRDRYGDRRARIVTSIAMFYDLEAPLAFMEDVREVLADDGVWVFEQSYLPSMLEMNAYDTICHEHIEYYGLRQIKWLTDHAGFKIVDVELNDTNGGSFAVTVAKAGSPVPTNEARIQTLLQEESRLGLDGLAPYQAFRSRVEAQRQALVEFFAQAAKAGRKVLGYGASTKGNVILQYCGLGPKQIPCMAEVNEDKFGCFTPGTRIPIVSEAEARGMKPDTFMVMPWHFRSGILEREKEYLRAGGAMLFPLPRMELVQGAAGMRHHA